MEILDYILQEIKSSLRKKLNYFAESIFPHYKARHHSDSDPTRRYCQVFFFSPIRTTLLFSSRDVVFKPITGDEKRQVDDEKPFVGGLWFSALPSQ